MYQALFLLLCPLVAQLVSLLLRPVVCRRIYPAVNRLRCHQLNLVEGPVPNLQLFLLLCLPVNHHVNLAPIRPACLQHYRLPSPLRRRPICQQLDQADNQLVGQVHNLRQTHRWFQHRNHRLSQVVNHRDYRPRSRLCRQRYGRVVSRRNNPLQCHLVNLLQYLRLVRRVFLVLSLQEALQAFLQRNQ